MNEHEETVKRALRESREPGSGIGDPVNELKGINSEIASLEGARSRLEGEIEKLDTEIAQVNCRLDDIKETLIGRGVSDTPPEVGHIYRTRNGSIVFIAHAREVGDGEMRGRAGLAVVLRGGHGNDEYRGASTGERFVIGLGEIYTIPEQSNPLARLGGGGETQSAPMGRFVNEVADIESLHGAAFHSMYQLGLVDDLGPLMPIIDSAVSGSEGQQI